MKVRQESHYLYITIFCPENIRIVQNRMLLVKVVTMLEPFRETNPAGDIVSLRVSC